jgi:hypothetical protein
MRPAFIRFDQLCKDWAEQSGEPFETVVACLCAHIREQAFSLYTFQHLPTGHYLGSGAFKDLDTQIQSDHAAIQRDACRSLGEINVSTEHMIAFCKQTKTRPPPSLGGSDRRFHWLDCQHLAPPTLGTIERQLTINAESKCRDWLIQLMKSGPPKINKSDYKAEAHTRFNVGSNAFNRAWANALAVSGNPAWIKPGPKPKLNS